MQFASPFALVDTDNQCTERRLADYRMIYDDEYRPESNMIMLVDLGDGFEAYCKGNKTGLVPRLTGSEADEAAKAAWYAELTDEKEAAPAATEEKKETGSEANEAPKAVWLPGLTGKDKAAPAATKEKKESRQELRKAKRDTEKESKRRGNGARIGLQLEYSEMSLTS